MFWTVSVWFASFLGLVQGLTEFLPVSSTAHLRIAPELLGQPDPGAAFSAVIQLGTLLSLLIYFARDLFVEVPRALWKRENSPSGRLPLHLAIGTVPIALAGIALQDFIEGEARSLYLVAAALVAVALVFVAAERVGHFSRRIDSVTWRDALLIGAVQALALVPGVSRSGATMAAAIFLRFRRADAARFSFLLGIPAIGGAGIFELGDALSGLGRGGWLPVAVGCATATLSGYAAIAWLLRYLSSRSLLPFALYRTVLGIVVATLCIAGVLAPRSDGRGVGLTSILLFE